MRFPPSFLDEIRDRIPVSEVVKRRVTLRKQGREWRGLSPFNKEKTPSFFVNDEKGFYHDFSSGKSGDQFRFLMEVEGLSFPEAVERLAEMAGLPLPEEAEEDEKENEKRKSIYEVLELAAQFFEKQFDASIGEVARTYAAGRGLVSATIKEFRIGYAPSYRFALREHLAKHGISAEQMIDAGLMVAGDDIPVAYDRFRDRLMIPIHDAKGRIVAFGGRALSPDAQAKYLNSPETSVFHKGSIIFNLHRARQPARDDGTVVVVEGYLDAIAVFQGGLKSVVATMGTAFTEDQIASLWRLSSEPVVCFDADKAGINAAYRSIDRILPLMTVGRAFRFAFLHGGKDPDDIVRQQGIAAFKAMLAGSLPLWDVLWEREISSSDIRGAGDQVKLEQKLLTILRNIKDSIVQRSYLNICRLELARLFWQREKRHRPPQSRSSLLAPADSKGAELQKLLLGLLVQYPEFVEEKDAAVGAVSFDKRLGEFYAALYDLLVTYKEYSVQFIYTRLEKSFFDILDDIHGGKTDQAPRGHRLFARFPIIKKDPPRDFVTRCIDHFIRKLCLTQLAAEIDELEIQAGRGDDRAGEQMVSLIREYQVEWERMTVTDSALAEEAKEIKRVALGDVVPGDALGSMALVF